MMKNINDGTGTFPASVTGSCKIFLIPAEYFFAQFLFVLAISMASSAMTLTSSMPELSSIIFVSCRNN